MHPALRFALLGCILPITAAASEPAAPAPPLPWQSSALSLETGLLWEIGTGTPIAYRLVPTQFSWRSARFLGWDLTDGSVIVVRNRFTLIATWVQHGPESHYLGVSGSPSIEWWNRSGTWSLFTGAGGGFGVLDSQGVKGAQGQDFTLNWFIRGGIEHVVSKNGSVYAGIMYQHMSNGGQTKPNPGIDALGFTVGYSWRK